MEVKTFEGGHDANLAYVVYDETTKKGFAIDPLDRQEIVDFIKENKIELVYVLNTHAHFDHIEGNSRLKEEFGCKIVSHELEQDKADIKVKDGQVLEVGNMKLKIIHTPGHTSGGICILVDKVIFTGDTLFLEHVGSTEYQGGSKLDMIESMKILMKLDDDIIVYPGHNYDYLEQKHTTIGHERRHNPFVLENKI